MRTRLVFGIKLGLVKENVPYSRTEGLSRFGKYIRNLFSSRKRSISLAGVFQIDFFKLSESGRIPSETLETHEGQLDIAEELLKRFRLRHCFETELVELPQRLREFLFPSDVIAEYAVQLNNASKKQDFILAISADQSGLSTLANLPWELCADPTDSKSFLGLNTDVALCRLLDVAHQNNVLDNNGPLRMLYAISNQEPKFDEEADAFRKSLDDFGKRMPSVLTSTGLETLTPSAEDLVNSMRAFQPHILLYIGHGRTTDSGIAQLQFENWTDVKTIASDVRRRCPEIFLVIMISCDSAWTAAEDPTVSGPHSWVSQGVPAVVVMQTRVSPEYAVAFLEKLLPTLFSGFSLPFCVHNARNPYDVPNAIGASRNVEWAAPALFVSEKAFEVIEPLQQWREKSELALWRRAALFPTIAGFVDRGPVQTKLTEWVSGRSGGVVLRGPLGSGRTALVAQLGANQYLSARNGLEMPSRPIFYIRVDQKQVHDLETIISVINEQAEAVGVPPISEFGGNVRNQLMVYLKINKVVLIIDDADWLPSDELENLTRYSPSLTTSLILLVIEERAFSDTIDILDLPPVTQDEARQYCLSVLGKNGVLAMQVHEQAHGSFLNLSHIVRRGRTESLPSPAHVNDAKAYVHQLRDLFTSELWNTIVKIALFPGGLPKAWLVDILGAEARFLLDNASVQGIVLRNYRFDRDWVQVSSFIEMGVKEWITESDRSLLRELLDGCARFINDFGFSDFTDHEVKLQLKSNAHVLHVFRGIQSLSLMVPEQRSYAIQLTRMIFEIFREKGQYLKAKELIESLLEAQLIAEWRYGDLLRLATTLEALGDTSYLDTVLQYMQESTLLDQMEDYYLVTFLNLKANLLKNQGDVDQINVLLQLYEQAEKISQQHLQSGPEAEWIQQLAHTYHNSALAHRFFRHDIHVGRELLARASQLFEEAGNRLLKARADMERAEVEIDYLGQATDWNQVDNLLHQSRSIFVNESSFSNIAFCEYQIARSYKKRQPAAFPRAIERYRECMEIADQNGLFRLGAIALRHHVELTWRDGSLSAENAILQLNLVISTLQHFANDAWADRVRRDAHALAAMIHHEASSNGEARRHLVSAWEIATSFLSRQSAGNTDRRRAARIVRMAITHYGLEETSSLLSPLDALLGAAALESEENAVRELNQLLQE